MKVLHISPKPVFPQVDGGCVAMADFLKLLSLEFDSVDHICIATPKHPFIGKDYQRNLPKNVCLIKCFEIDTSVHYFKLFFSLFGHRSYQLSRFYLREMEDYLAKISREYDYIFLESIFTTPYLNSLNNSQHSIFVRTHNVEYGIWETKSKSTRNLLKRRVFERFSRQMRTEEINAYQKVTGLIHISSADEDIFKTLIPQTNQTTIALSIDESDVVEPNLEKVIDFNFGFLGSFNWQPNVDAIHKIMKDIFPEILKDYPMAKFYLAGSNTEKLAKGEKWLENLGTVEHIADFYNQIDVFLAPLSSGSGLKIKVVEAILKGKIVLGSAIAFEGLEFLEHKNIIHQNESVTSFLASFFQNPRKYWEQVLTQQKQLLNNFGTVHLQRKLHDFVSK